MGQSFSVCMSVYKNDNAHDFINAVHSIYYQTLPPNDIVLVVDGPVPDSISKAIEELKSEIPVMNVFRLEKNMGHATARQKGLEAAKNNLVAIMDSDDISVPNRFELQINEFEKHPETSVIGGLIREFIGDPEFVVGERIVPKDDSDIKSYMKSRCPMNLVTVMLKKDDVIAVGGFQDWYCEEDYYLWLRLALSEYKFYNIQENLVNVRVGKEMYQRRGGWKYFKSEARLQKYMHNKNVIGFPMYLYNVTVRFIVQVLMPNKLRGWVFRKFARS